ncbi:MAG: alpha/beta hydrolase-fold protein, partial [Thermanaerothrix sp.]|nr:alpha/beta hydrolase-fold protein [Thermanaerothrix sp.]
PYEEYALRDPLQSAFGQTIIENLIPWIEDHFATCATPGCRALGGISRGAGWAIHIAIQHPDLFVGIGAHSLAPFWGDDLRLYYRIADYPPEQWPHFYLDSGAHDRYLKPAQALVNRLAELGIPHEWHLNSGEHDITYWQTHLEDYLTWYAAQWQTPNP